ILVGVFLSFLLYVPRAARVQMTELVLTPEGVIRERVADDSPCSRILIFSLEGELFFGSGPELEEHLATITQRAESGPQVILLRLKRVRNADAVCLAQLDAFVEQLAARRVRILFCGVRIDLARVLRSTGLEARLGSGNLFLETPGVIWSSTL